MSQQQATPAASASSHHHMSRDEFRKEFKGDILEPSDERYQARLQRFYSQTTVEETGKPKYIVGPKSDQDVVCAIRFARGVKNGFAIIAGGHWVGQNCCKGVLIDLNMHMNKVEIIDHHHTKSRKAFRVQGGATWDELDRVGMQQGLATVSANNCGNGVVATTLAGGYGFLVGEHGLGVDQVIEVDIVLADGKIVTASDKHHTDLFWAVRGAGPAFGCITSITLCAHEQNRQVCMGNLKFVADKVNDVARSCTQWNESCGMKESAVVVISRPDPAQPPFINVHLFFNGPEDQARQKFEKIVQAGPVEEQFMMLNYEDANRVLESYAPHNHIEGQGANPRLAQSGAICTGFNDRNLKSVLESFQSLTQENDDFKTSAICIDLYPDLSKTSRKHRGDADMCFNGRTRIHPVNILLQYNDAANTSMAQSRARELSQMFLNLDPSPKDLDRVPRYAAYTPTISGKECWGDNYPRLRKLKGEYDPDNEFDRWIIIEPSEHQKA